MDEFLRLLAQWQETSAHFWGASMIQISPALWRRMRRDFERGGLVWVDPKEEPKVMGYTVRPNRDVPDHELWLLSPLKMDV